MKICPVCSTEYADDVKFCPNDGQTLRSTTRASDLVGQIVADRYHVVKKLGEGGMGQVYLAEHVKMGRRSAIKVMNPAMVHDPDAVARFNREASNASRINHPNVCAIYDFGETADGLIFLAMEFIEGEPLTDLLERKGALSLPEATTIFLQTADALQAAHELGIVHRDLKPDNIMLTKATVKVVDFGIAKAIGGDESGQKVTKTGLVIGTPEFMSPEQLSGDKLDGRSDLYALALVLYRMLTGKLPFEATTAQEVMVKRLTDEPLKLADARPDLSFPPGLQQVLDTALARTPAERFQSVAKFAADVTAVTGRPAARSVPATEAKTELLDPRAASATVPLQTHKKRRLVPIAAIVALILASGGAWMVLNGGNRLSPTPADTTRALLDTAARPSTTRTVAAQSQPTRQTANSPARFNLAAVGSALNKLMDSIDAYPNKMVRDSAAALFHASGIGVKDSAFAAFVIGNTYFQMRDRAQGCDWVRRASNIDTVSAVYSRFIQAQCN